VWAADQVHRGIRAATDKENTMTSTTSLRSSRRRITSAATLVLGAGAIAIGVIAPVANADVIDLLRICEQGNPGPDGMRKCCILVGGSYEESFEVTGCRIRPPGSVSPNQGTPPAGPSKTPAPVNSTPPPPVQK
jgi:hypothetical protein